MAFETLKTYWKRVSLRVREHLGTSVSDWAVDWIKATVSWDDHALRDCEEQQRFYDSRDFECFQSVIRASLDSRNVPPRRWSLDVAGGHFEQSESVFLTSFSWAASLTRFQGAEFFDLIRTTERRGLFGERTHTRTCTRVRAGHVQMRYHDCVQFARRELSRCTVHAHQ